MSYHFCTLWIKVFLTYYSSVISSSLWLKNVLTALGGVEKNGGNLWKLNGNKKTQGRCFIITHFFNPLLCKYESVS